MLKKLAMFAAQKLAGQGKTTGKEVIKNVPIAKNIDTKKAIEQKVVKTVDKAFKDADPQGVYTQTLANKKKKSQLKRDKDPNLKQLELSIIEKIGLNVSIKNDKNNKGQIKIEYKNLDQLNKIVEILKANY